MTNMHLQEKLLAVLVDKSRKLARDWLSDIFKKKLAEIGANTAPELIAALVEHTFAGSGERFTWNNDIGTSESPLCVSLAITDADLTELDRIETDFLASLPKIVEKVSATTAAIAFKALNAHWPRQHAYEFEERAAFKERLEERYGKAFDFLRMLYAISLEIGQNAIRQRQSLNPRQPGYLSDVLIRLHVRACQVTAEVITLMENGYADGAMARWRTLHEIIVVALVIWDFGEPIAERYVEHTIVETKRAAEMYSSVRVRAGDEPLSVHEMQEMQKAYDNVVQKFGKEFKTEYGWAAHHLQNPNPNFSHLEAAAGHAALRSDYKMASYNIHAGPKGIFFKLGTFDSSCLIAGASNVGFVAPGCNTAYALTQMNVLILERRQQLDEIVTMRTLMHLRDATCHAFARADHKLQQDDAQIRQV